LPTKRHRLRVVKEKAEEHEVIGKSLVCPRCKDRKFMAPVSRYIGGAWFHIGDKCPECSYEFMLRDAPN